MGREILIATRNLGKVGELTKLLTDLPFVWRNLSEFTKILEVAETGVTFVENAEKKARDYALQSNLWTLADDSGLEVEALNNAPGVFSARFGGSDLTDAQRTQKLLAKVNQTKNKERRARFICVIALANPLGEIVHKTNGICYGHLSVTAAGTSGFGYDSIFIPENFELTFAQLSEEIKNKISHRAQAVQQMSRFLRDFFNVSLDQANEHR